MDLDVQLGRFLPELSARFPGQLVFCGLQGSYGRGEATENSDVDLVVVLERLGRGELEAYRALIAAMPFADRACGFVCAREALAHWPNFDALQLLLDTKPLYGDLAGLLPAFGPEDIAQAAVVGCANLYHAACHAYLFQGEAGAWLPALRKSAFFALRMEVFRRTGRYIARRQCLPPLLSPEEQALLEGGGDPGNYCAAVLRWAEAGMAGACTPL